MECKFCKFALILLPDFADVILKSYANADGSLFSIGKGAGYIKIVNTECLVSWLNPTIHNMNM